MQAVQSWARGSAATPSAREPSDLLKFPALQAALLIAAFLVLRLGLAAVIPLSIDEAYAVVVSRSHSLSYFDHPPLGFALARLMADATGCECRFAVRLPYVLLGSLSALLLFDLTRQAYGAVAAFWAVAWYSVAPFFLISAGHFVVPDGPLDFFLLASAWFVAPMLLGGKTHNALPRWIAGGLALGLAMMSKYQAGLFAISALLVLLLTKPGRAQLRTAGPWVAAAIAALGLLPVLVWNMRHGWISLAFQSGRGMANEGHLLHPTNFGITLLGQAGYVWPPIWLIAMICLWRAARSPGSAADRFFLLIAALPVVFFDAAALFSSHSLPHWSMSGFLFTFPLVGQWCSDFAQRRPARLNASFAVAAIVVPLLAIGFALQATTGAFTRPFFERAPKFDVNWQIVDWSALAGLLEASQIKDPGVFAVAPNWMQGARVGHALGPDVPIDVLPGDPRHFQFMDHARLNGLGNGFLIAALNPADEAASEKTYRDSLAGLYEASGPARRVTQRIARFPVFDILILPVKRTGMAPAQLPDKTTSQTSGGPQP
ncbi:glycosyltransferase family 39 protein [Mesorhizobium sp.]|uniref:glycosyltransferase family 39 protein n=1 Tax=Mesorhizobium sp. TaxID=1871066 RepID=UPI0025E4CA42|nr:glycosyltransferase family 39 protein [Mesorhizobium sp.]